MLAQVGVRAPGLVRGRPAEADTLAANIDVVLLVHAFDATEPRRLERELVLAFDSGAKPAVVLTKADLVDDPVAARRRADRGRDGCACPRRQRDHR